MSEPSKPLEGVNALLSFTVENSYSYRDETEFSMTATRLAEKASRRDLKLAGRKNPIGVLPVAGIFGPNASGKTTILRAMADMRQMVRSSFLWQGISGNRNPFALDPNALNSPTSYTVEIVIEGVRWNYGFEIDNDKVKEEYAYYYPRGRQARVFHRKKNSVYFGIPLPNKKVFEQILHDHDNTLLLSMIGALKYESTICTLYNWFLENLLYVGSYNRDARIDHTAEKIEDEYYKSRILNLIRSADLGITDIRQTKPDSDAIRVYKDIALTHKGKAGEAELNTIDESLGTRAWIGLIGPVLDAVKNGSVLLIDELSGSLHPDIVSTLITIFQDKEKNPQCAQMVFNSHDMTIFDRNRSFLGLDQIWFTEKNIDGVSSLYNLSDFTPTPRRDETLREYLNGRYGALPVLDESEIMTALEKHQYEKTE